MSKLTLIFPIAAVLFLILIFSEYVPCLRRGLSPLRGADRSFTRRDALAAGLLTLVYGATAFAGLGLTTAPQSFCRFRERGEYALIELQEETQIGAVMYYTGLHTGNYYLQFSRDGENWLDQVSMEQSYGDLFKWRFAELGEGKDAVRYIRIIAGSPLWLGEVLVYNGDGKLIPAETMSYDSGCAKLFDEQEEAPLLPNYMNSSYFDEIYHVRTAYEHLMNVKPYEISHPPLGKLIISLGIRIFGLTPFGWRFMGTLFGVLMVPAMYIFLKRMFGGTSVPLCSSAVFAFDFMHFTQTRLATIDTYAVAFIILMYLFMFMYLSAERGEGAPRRNWLLPLGLSGLAFGLGAASKWTCLYAGAGLGLLWLLDRGLRGAELCSRGRKDEYIRETAENILWCLLFFVAIPCAVYYASYYPYGRAEGMEGIGMFFSGDYLDLVLDNQKYMFSYHSGVDAAHPYSSVWWQWMLDIRPILYYLEYFGDGTKSSFGAFVNPLLCWGGLLAMLFMAYLSIFRRDKKAAFILIGYLAQLLPWVFVSRVTFAYHYFPSTVFLTLALGRVFSDIRSYRKSCRRAIYSFTAVSIVLFAAFYPALSGVRAPEWYFHSFLRWLPESWPF